MKKILIIDEMHPSIISLLEKEGYLPDYQPTISKQEVLQTIDQYHGLIVRSKIFIGKELLERATKLEFIARAGAGMDQIVEDEVYKRNIKLVNAPEGNRDAVGEHAIGMLLTLLNKINSADREIRNGIWLREENRGIELGGKTVAIIGYGNNGNAFARKLKGFDCTVLAHDILEKHHIDEHVKEVSMAEIFEQADIVSFHVPLTGQTDKLANKTFFNSFKKNIWVINTARGQVVVLKDLLDAIDSGKVQGACLDVLENEKMIEFKTQDLSTYTRLMNNHKIILTPHVAGWTQESYVKINEVLVKKIVQLYQ